MKSLQHKARCSRKAFTLIEILVVIAIISVLAALIFPVSGAIKKKAMIARTQAELAQLETAIERYKAKYGFYPPDNPGNPAINQLYFELLGTVLTNVDYYQTLDGSARIRASDLVTTFGPRVAGFVNSSRAGGGDDDPVATSFLQGLKPTQTGELAPNIKLLACSVQWPERHIYQPVPAKPGLNPWRYVSSNPANSPNSCDLWVDILIGGKTNRIGNWSRVPLIVSSP